MVAMALIASVAGSDLIRGLTTGFLGTLLIFPGIDPCQERPDCDQDVVSRPEHETRRVMALHEAPKVAFSTVGPNT